MTRCDDIRVEMAAFVAGEPAPTGDEAWESVRAHVGGCAPCADHCASVRRVWGAVGEIRMEDVPRGALDRLHARIRAEAAARGPAGWVLGLADAALALIALVLISRVIPVALFCRLCTLVVHGTPFEGWVYTGEFTAGTVLSALSVLVALLGGRLAWRRESTGRLAAAGFAYALLAIAVGPNHVVVGNATAFAAWGAGAALGTLALVLGFRTVSAPSA